MTAHQLCTSPMGACVDIYETRRSMRALSVDGRRGADAPFGALRSAALPVSALSCNPLPFDAPTFETGARIWRR